MNLRILEGFKFRLSRLAVAMAWECFVFVFTLVQPVVPLFLQWPLAQLFPGQVVQTSVQSVLLLCL
jgi:hypothetical protein